MFHIYYSDGTKYFYINGKIWKHLDTIFSNLIEYRYDSFGGNELHIS